MNKKLILFFIAMAALLIFGIFLMNKMTQEAKNINIEDYPEYWQSQLSQTQSESSSQDNK